MKAIFQFEKLSTNKSAKCVICCTLNIKIGTSMVFSFVYYISFDMCYVQCVGEIGKILMVKRKTENQYANYEIKSILLDLC